MYMYVLWGISFVKFSHEMFFFFFLSHAISLVMILRHDYQCYSANYVVFACALG